MGRVSGDPFGLFFSMTWIASLVVHLAFFAFATVMVSGATLPDEKAARANEPLVFKLAELPKGSGVGPIAPTKSREAKVNPFQRQVKKIKEALKESDMPKNAKAVVKSKSKARSHNARDALRSSAIERLKQQMKNTSEAEGGGGTGDQDGGSVAKIYVANVRSKIKRNWRLPAGLSQEDMHRTGQVVVRIDSSGNLIGANIVSTSGKSTIDSSLLTAIRNAAPFGRPPLEVSDQAAGGGIQIPFRASDAK